MNDIELYMSIQLATALLALFAGLIPHVGWAIRKLVPTFMALKGASGNDFLRRQALDALSFGVAQKEALACLYLIEEGPHEAHYTSMGELCERSVDPFHCLVFGGKGPACSSPLNMVALMKFGLVWNIFLSIHRK